MYQLTVIFHPAHELLNSIRAAASDARVLDGGAEWLDAVCGAVGSEIAQEVATPEFAAAAEMLDLLAWCAPPTDDIPAFVRWLDGLSGGDLLELLLPHLADAQLPALRRVSAHRQQHVELLHAWHERYFSSVDAAVLNGLLRDAERVRVQASHGDAVEMIEEVTNGIYLEPGAMPSTVLLIPQYHCRPLNVFSMYRELGMVQYAVDVLPTPPGEPSTDLLRLTRALADESRLRILHLLADGPLGYADVADRVHLAKSTAHHHLVALRTAGLVRAHLLPGSASVYSLRPRAAHRVAMGLESYLTRRKE